MLSGYRIVELGSYIAGPATAGMMCDWGAQVIKIEPLTGDPIRWLRPAAHEGGSSPNFEFDNRGKRSITLDVRQAAAREIIGKLVAQADVFVTNLRPGILAKYGLDYATLAPLHPRLVYTSVTGFGLEGPAADVPAFDVTAFWGRSGMGGQATPPEGTPSWRPGIGDHTCALTACLGTMTALLDRTRTGRGRLVEASLLRAGAYAGGYDLAEQLRRGETYPRTERAKENTRTSQIYPAAGGEWFSISPNELLPDWENIYIAAGRPELIEDPRFATLEARNQNALALTNELDRLFSQIPRDEIGRRLTVGKVVWGPIQTSEEVVQDEVAAIAGCFIEVEDRRGAPFRAPAPPIRFPGETFHPGLVPEVGEHTDQILAELGYDAAAISDLRAAQAIG